MNHKDYNYYEANAANVRLEDITSCDGNKRILQQLRDGNRISITFSGSVPFSDDRYEHHFCVMERDDLGWMGYFIGRSDSLKALYILAQSLDQEREQQSIRALSDGIAWNRSIRELHVKDLSSYGFTTLLGTDLTHLEGFDPLETGIGKLERLSLVDCNIGDAEVAAIAHGLRSIGSSLTYLNLSSNSIGSEGLTALVSALANATSIQDLHLNGNDLSTAAVGLRSLSNWLQTPAIKLNRLILGSCRIDDEGLRALSADAVNNCRVIDLSDSWPDSSNNITTYGLRHLSNSLQSESCCLEYLCFKNMIIEEDGAEVLARCLVGNKSLRQMSLVDDEVSISFSSAGWSAFSTVLCNTSTVNSTYLSNHTIHALWDEGEVDFDDVLGVDKYVLFYLQLNKYHPLYAARYKILMNHTHLDMTPLLEWELKFLPLVLGWFERAKPCTTLSVSNFFDRIFEYVEDNSTILEESDDEFQSRILTALYEFVRGTPRKVLERRSELSLVAAYDDKIAMVQQGNKRLREEVEERDRKIARLGEENRRLRGIVRIDLES